MEEGQVSERQSREDKSLIRSVRKLDGGTLKRNHERLPYPGTALSRHLDTGYGVGPKR
jgi:hypothetical protein